MLLVWERMPVKPDLFICPVGLVWFARYCGKMYSRHLFSYGGLSRETRDARNEGGSLRRKRVSFFVPFPSRAFSHARFVRQTKKKKETARSLRLTILLVIFRGKTFSRKMRSL